MEIVLAFAEHATQMHIYGSVDKQMAGFVVIHVPAKQSRSHTSLLVFPL